MNGVAPGRGTSRPINSENNIIVSSSRGINIALLLVLLLAVAGVAWLYLGERSVARDGAAPAEAVAVIAETTREQPLVDSIQALGTARASQAVEITSRVSSVVEEIRFEEGGMVQTGQVLVTLEAAEVQANLEAARAALAESLSLYERNRELYATGAVSVSQLQQLETRMRADRALVAVAEAALAEHVIRAPFAGRVGLLQVSVGSLVQPGAVITTLDDTNPIELDFSVPELFVGTLEPGQAIVARSGAYPETEFNGTVQTVATRVDTVTRAVTVRAVLPNPARLIKPGMFLTVRLIRKTAPALLIPEHAVVPENERQFVFVVEDGVARKRAVQTGRRRPGMVEITAGLAPGETIIVEGTLKVRDGTPVTVAEDAA